MIIAFTPKGWEQYSYWLETDIEVYYKINRLINEIKRTPFKGEGKPEPLKGNLKGCWSRRITGEHRLVYVVEGKGDLQKVTFIAAKFHY